jgi:hypothetical protein
MTRYDTPVIHAEDANDASLSYVIKIFLMIEKVRMKGRK